jgi:hypothetical protein
MHTPLKMVIEMPTGPYQDRCGTRRLTHGENRPALSQFVYKQGLNTTAQREKRYSILEVAEAGGCGSLDLCEAFGSVTFLGKHRYGAMRLNLAGSEPRSSLA